MPELKTRILIVDDDQRLRDLLLRYLGEQGFEAKAVHDAAGMDRLLGRERYDLIVLDLMLPGEDGLAICRRLVRRFALLITQHSLNGIQVTHTTAATSELGFR